MSTMELTTTFETVTCANCATVFALPAHYALDLRRKHATFYCPKGHSQFFPGESDIERAERLRKAANSDRSEAWAAYQALQDQLRASQRQKAALKGQLTKARNKIANGVCPVGGCRRHFDNVQAHIATEHPSWHVTDPETGSAAVL